jgi:hypothetical protein
MKKHLKFIGKVHCELHCALTRNKDHAHRPTATFYDLKKMQTILASKYSTVYHLLSKVL